MLSSGGPFWTIWIIIIKISTNFLTVFGLTRPAIRWYPIPSCWRCNSIIWTIKTHWEPIMLCLCYQTYQKLTVAYLNSIELKLLSLALFVDSSMFNEEKVFFNVKNCSFLTVLAMAILQLVGGRWTAHLPNIQPYTDSLIKKFIQLIKNMFTLLQFVATSWWRLDGC